MHMGLLAATVVAVSTLSLEFATLVTTIGLAGLPQLPEPASLVMLGAAMLIGAHTVRRQSATHSRQSARAGQRVAALSISA
jgi:hypothetical protein